MPRRLNSETRGFTSEYQRRNGDKSWERYLFPEKSHQNGDDGDHNGDWDDGDGDHLSEAFKSIDFIDRVHYDTIMHVHEPTHAWSMEKLIKELQKVNEYDELVEFKRSMKIEGSLKNKSGDEKLKDLKFWLDNLGLKRHIHQIRFHEHMIKASLSKIYEVEWETQYESIMKKFSIQKMKRELLFSCPRRFGKTFSVALYCAAYMLSVPNCQVAVFSTGKRTAKKLMMLILSFLSRFPGFEDHIKTKNQEDLILKFGPFDERILSCYPSTVKVCFIFLLSFSFYHNIMVLHHRVIVVVIMSKQGMYTLIIFINVTTQQLHYYYYIRHCKNDSKHVPTCRLIKFVIIFIIVFILCCVVIFVIT